MVNIIKEEITLEESLKKKIKKNNKTLKEAKKKSLKLKQDSKDIKDNYILSNLSNK